MSFVPFSKVVTFITPPFSVFHYLKSTISYPFPKRQESREHCCHRALRCSDSGVRAGLTAFAGVAAALPR